MAEADTLVAEFDGLHPVLDRDLARAAAISHRLRELADAQRQETVPDAELLPHRVWAWRMLDLRAHRAADMASNGHNHREWFEHQEQDIVRRGRWRVSPYDEALLRFSGDPLPPRTLTGPGLSAVGVVARVGVIIVCLTPATLIVITGNAGGIGAAIVPFLIRPLRDWLRPLFDGPADSPPDEVAESCPGVRAYCVLLARLLESVNGHTAITSTDDVESEKFAETLADMEVTLNQMRRVVVPPVAQDVHVAMMRVAEVSLAISRDRIAGTGVGADFSELQRLQDLANESIAALSARCP